MDCISPQMRQNFPHECRCCEITSADGSKPEGRGGRKRRKGVQKVVCQCFSSIGKSAVRLSSTEIGVSQGCQTFLAVTSLMERGVFIGILSQFAWGCEVIRPAPSLGSGRVPDRFFGVSVLRGLQSYDS